MQIPDTIEREVVIDAPVERVWTLITDPEHVAAWFSEAGAEIELRPGGDMTLSWEGHGTAQARVERVEPERVFAFRWPLTGEHLAEGNSTLVEFTLAPEGDGTRVRVVESGFASLAMPDEEQRKHVDDNTEGWGIELGHLAEHAERVAA
jgi:uncharacterized protein YndB with AHSA1/START domain